MVVRVDGSYIIFFATKKAAKILPITTLEVTPNSTGRALSSFSFLLGKDYTNILFRSVMGIEALYAKGTSSLQEQVREKSQLILGKQEAFKKVYTNMYNFRSRYIHGDLDFPTDHSLDMTN
ncbi:hypothetical protein AWH56_001945 [Anaerobacillus isosaccharinicus]|nr:hypothetical protein [Anaerobacillus isosaccharinicus]MBA5585184.1 hypothetical protein [Anaerobacillus isosaccharinicus]QOY36478.1 hypothetical protein AWH56_001945 [Anaerobacillus isosaccharinicus]